MAWERNAGDVKRYVFTPPAKDVKRGYVELL